jgi:hypothetical protein
MKYDDGTLVKVGDIFTDGSSGHEDVRLKNRAKVLYVDKFTLVWFPLNDFTTHTDFKMGKFTSKTWGLSAEPKRVELSELTEDELNIYNTTNSYLEHVKDYGNDVN